MLIISQHCVQACEIPLGIFDEFHRNGGKLGALLYDNWRSSMENAWEAACAAPGDVEKRCGLPDKCDRAWFLRRFCSEREPESDDKILSALSPFNGNTSLAILTTLPQALRKCFDLKTVPVRSVEHRLIGMDESDSGIPDLNDLRKTMYQCWFKGLSLNASEFDLDRKVRLSMCLDENNLWAFDKRDSALHWLRRATLSKGLARQPSPHPYESGNDIM